MKSKKSKPLLTNKQIQDSIKVFEDIVSGPVKKGEGIYEYKIDTPHDFNMVTITEMIQKYWLETEDKKDNIAVYTDKQGMLDFHEELKKQYDKLKTDKVFTILEDPMLPPKVGLNFYEFTVLLDDDYMMPGDMVVINKNEDGIHEDVAVIQYLPQKNPQDPGWYYTMQLATRYDNYYVSNKYLQEGCKIVHIGSWYSS